jgi:hypothetical protein
VQIIVVVTSIVVGVTIDIQIMVNKVLLGHLVLQELLDYTAHLVQLVQSVQQDHLGHLEPLEYREHLEPLEYRDHLDHRDLVEI